MEDLRGRDKKPIEPVPKIRVWSRVRQPSQVQNIAVALETQCLVQIPGKSIRHFQHHVQMFKKQQEQHSR